MPFLADAQQLLGTLPPGPMRETLDFLVQHAIGRSNAVPLAAILAHLATQGHTLTREQFQQTILKSTRDDTIFIGSCPSGYFLIDTIDDAREMARFYETRIAAEKAHLDHLRDLAQQQGWAL